MFVDTVDDTVDDVYGKVVLLSDVEEELYYSKKLLEYIQSIVQSMATKATKYKGTSRSLQKVIHI